MKFSLVNGYKTEPRPGLQGTCAYCQSDTITKCGQVKIWHWAHKSKFSCDPWWENETEWHRAWKNQYPAEWQENIHIDFATGEKHIADIKTASELVIEFQHSAIHPDEIKTREAFYKSMVWLVDGTRLKKDDSRFRQGFNNLEPEIIDGYFRIAFPDKCFHKSWLERSKPVYFDFQGIISSDQTDEMHDPLWCLLPGREQQYALVARISRKEFIDFSSNDSKLLPTRDRFSAQLKKLQADIKDAVEAVKKIKELQAAQAAAHQQYLRSLIPRRFMHRHL